MVLQITKQITNKSLFIVSENRVAHVEKFFCFSSPIPSRKQFPTLN